MRDETIGSWAVVGEGGHKLDAGNLEEERRAHYPLGRWQGCGAVVGVHCRVLPQTFWEMTILPLPAQAGV